VVDVSWDDCQKFVGKLNAKLGGKKFALPTEAQWEYACRAGSTTRYCFGDDKSRLGEYAWYSANSRGKLHPVGEKKPNAWGLYDMHGNVQEWCQDPFSTGYSRLPVVDPNGTGNNAYPYRVVRGACRDTEAWLCRSACRDGVTPGRRDAGLGLRLSRIAVDK
jgi:formylglycine-generating enzyme required for sulfatase activity